MSSSLNLQASAKPAPEPKAPVQPAEAVQLAEGTAFVEALTAAVTDDQIVPEKSLLTMVNKLLRKDRENLFRTEPQKTNLHSRVVCIFSIPRVELCPSAAGLLHPPARVLITMCNFR